MIQQTNNSFTIDVMIHGKTETLQVFPQETSDGVPYYTCKKDDETLTEIRRGVKQEWAQLWGELDKDSYIQIGQAIEEKTELG
ncbi:hypothetical protein [Olivibacter sitiensis]|uniref:hypothetical protein n=1 Tax=Olivibacter sitiensis TaxID=376470 RepID=UPI0003F5ABDC|nr:hypothetical protein [Olivibacter sitiensis]